MEEFSKNTPPQEIAGNTSPRFQSSLLTQTLPELRELHGAPAELQTAAGTPGCAPLGTHELRARELSQGPSLTLPPTATPPKDTDPAMETALAIPAKENSISNLDVSKMFKLK